MSHKLILVGRRYGHLLVVEESHSDGKHIYWKCKCDCGNETIVCGDSLKQGFTKSCGCLNIHKIKMRSTTHGQTGSRLYKTWINMISRCENENTTGFKHWGGRGIKVCDEWRNSFESFYNWTMESGYQEGLTIDRINNNGDYEPSNCQWLTNSENVKKMWSDKRKSGVSV